MTTTENGNQVNITNFRTLINECKNFGKDYAPQNPDLIIVNLNLRHSRALAAVDAVNTAIALSKNAISERELAFQPLPALASAIQGAAEAADFSEQTVNSVRGMVRKLLGIRAGKKPAPAPADGNNPDAVAPKTNSVSQLSADNRTANLKVLIAFLKEQPNYQPNETHLSIASLEALYTDLNTKNEAVIKLNADLRNTRTLRDEIMYNGDKNLIDIAQKVKQYVKSLYTSKSTQYKVVNAIPFKRR